MTEILSCGQRLKEELGYHCPVTLLVNVVLMWLSHIYIGILTNMHALMVQKLPA